MAFGIFRFWHFKDQPFVWIVRLVDVIEFNRIVHYCQPVDSWFFPILHLLILVLVLTLTFSELFDNSVKGTISSTTSIILFSILFQMSWGLISVMFQLQVVSLFREVKCLDYFFIPILLSVAAEDKCGIVFYDLFLG